MFRLSSTFQWMDGWMDGFTIGYWCCHRFKECSMAQALPYAGVNVELSCICLWSLPSALWIVGALREPPEIASWWTPSVIGWSSSRWGITSPTYTTPLSWFGCHCFLLIHMSMNAPEARSTKTKRSRTVTDANWKRDILRASVFAINV